MQTAIAPVLAFSPDLPTQSLLVQLEESQLEILMREGGWLKGGQPEKAVFCTEEATYTLKTTGTTNTRLLVAKDEWEVLATAPSHLELSAGPAFVPSSLHPLLQEADGRDFSEVDKAAGGRYGRAHSTLDLAACSQASTGEVVAALEGLGAVCLDHRWFTMSAASQAQCTEMLLLTLTQHGWDPTAVPSEDLCQSMQEDGFLSGAVAHCASQLATERCCLSNPTWNLDQAKVAATQGGQREEWQETFIPDSLDEVMLDTERQ